MAVDETDEHAQVPPTLTPKEELLRNVHAVSAHQVKTHMSCAKVAETTKIESVFTFVTSGLDETGPLTGNCVLSSCDHSFSSAARKGPHESVGESNKDVVVNQEISSSCLSEQKSDILLQSTGGAASTAKEHLNVLLKSSGSSCTTTQLDASHSNLSSLCESSETERERKASSESRLSFRSPLSLAACDSSSYSGQKSRANMNSNAYSEMSVRKSSLCSHGLDYTDMTKNLGKGSSKQIVSRAERCSTKLTGRELSLTSGATARCDLVNSEHYVDDLCAINNEDSSSPAVSKALCESSLSISTQKCALVNRNQYPSSSSCDVSSLHLNHNFLHITEDHHVCRGESQQFNHTNTIQSFRNNPSCVLTSSNNLGPGSCLHSQDFPPSHSSCLSASGGHVHLNDLVSECTNAGTPHLRAPGDCSLCCAPIRANACHCAGHRYTNQVNSSSSSDHNCSLRTNSGCCHSHNNCGNGSLLHRDSFNPSCEIDGHGAVTAVCGNSSSSTPMSTINRCSDGHQRSLGSLHQFLPINAADVAVSWASNGNGGMSSFVYSTSGPRESSARHCCHGRTEICSDSHGQHPTSSCKASSHLGSPSWPNHSGGCHPYQNNSHLTATQAANNIHSSGIHASHQCDSSSNNAAIYGRRSHRSSSIYGTTAGRECSAAQHFEGAGTSQQHRLAVPDGSHNCSNLIRPTQHRPAHYQNLSGSATSLHSSSSHGSGCGHWCTSCRVKLAQGSGSTLRNTDGDVSEEAVKGGCSSKAVKHIASQNSLALQSSNTDMHSIDSRSSNSLDSKASPEPQRSLKSKMMQKFPKHRQRIPSGGKESSGSITIKKKPAFPFWKTCLSFMTKTPLNGTNGSSLTSHAVPDSTSPSGSIGTASYSHVEDHSSDTLERGPVAHCDAHPNNSLSQIPLSTLLRILPKNASSERVLYPSDDEPRYTPDPVRTAAAASNSARHRLIGTVPLNINSMLGLQMLLERSLGLDLAGPSALSQERISQHLERLNSSMDEEASASCNNTQRTVHTQVDYVHFLVPDLLSITSCSFYWGKMDRYEAERLLVKRPEGTFLLRDSAQDDYLFSVSFRRYSKSLHARIEQGNHKFSFDSHDPGVFASDTVCGLVEHYKDPSCCMFFEPMLTNPLCRTFPFPLQHLCRATICSNSTYDGINKLELPKTLRHYLKEYHYKQLVRVRSLDH